MTMSLTSNASQATQIEQARAVAEVLGALDFAANHPRDETKALVMFERSCRRLEFAQRAFYRYKRGGENVTGVTIGFAQEAARCWQNLRSGMTELVRRTGESEMLAFAVDLEMNTQRSNTFVNPHTGYVDTPKRNDDGSFKPARQLVAVRDVRENNTSAAARVEREMILAILPTWYVEMGKAWCVETIGKQGDGKPIEERRLDIIRRFEEMGVRRDELETKLGQPADRWLEVDLATLIVIGQSLRNGETTVESEFRSNTPAQPTEARVSLNELGGGSAAPAPAAPAADGEEPKITRTRMNELFAVLGECGLGGKSADAREKRLRLCEILADRELNSSTDLTENEGVTIIGVMRGWGEQAAERAAAMLAIDEPTHDDTPDEPEGGA